MIIIVVNKDGIKNVFENQTDSQDLLDSVSLAVSSGTGFALTGPKGMISYGPGTVARVGFTQDQMDEK